MVAATSLTYFVEGEWWWPWTDQQVFNVEGGAVSTCKKKLSTLAQIDVEFDPIAWFVNRMAIQSSLPQYCYPIEVDKFQFV